MSHLVNQQVDAFLRRHLLEMKTEREDDAGATVHAPEQHADLVLRILSEVQVPEEKFPVESISLAPERSAKDTSIRFVASGHEALQVMARDQLVKDCSTREVAVVAAHAHHLLFLRHRVGREGNQDCFTTKKEWADELALGIHHLHS